MSDCPREGKWFGCKFEARYEDAPTSLNLTGAASYEAARIIKGIRFQRYVRDVCVRCGKTIERRD